MQWQHLPIVICALTLLPEPAAADSSDWVDKSNTHAKIVLDSIAKFNPEGAGGLGVDGLDEEIVDLRPRIYERGIAEQQSVLAELEKRHDAEKDPIVRQDLEILMSAVADSIRSAQLEREYMLPYLNMSQQVFGGIRALIDPQISADRYPAAIVRLNRYAGLEKGYKPITEHARERTEERLATPGLHGPYRVEVLQDLERADTFISGLEELLAGAKLDGWQKAYKALTVQLKSYNQWIRDEILPRSRADFRLPVVMYEDALKNFGVDATAEELIEAATRGYMDIRNEMDALAPLVAKEKGYPFTDYRKVIRKLKDDQAIDGDKLLDRYYETLGKIEKIIVDENLVSLPKRQAGIRIATAAETAASPVAHLDVPRLIGNTGEYPFFVIPQLTRNADGSWQRTDDTYEAGAWTLTAHEARPGHELQFSAMIESGVSSARAIFALNSANVEGWALYAEAISKPFMPLDGQLIGLQYRLLRAARMFLDPMLNTGQITPEAAKRLLTDDVVIDEGWAQNEIERYTYRSPGQATSYYYGYSKMQALRTRTELILKENFDQRSFHDFVLAQGALPPHMLAEAVTNVFLPAQEALAAQSATLGL